jgi:hypothetical protein
LAEAAKVEPELAALQDRLRSERVDNMRRVTRALRGLATLRVSESEATNTLWALTSPELFSLLTGVRAWTRGQYAGWLQDSLTRLLFLDGPN